MRAMTLLVVLLAACNSPGRIARNAARAKDACELVIHADFAPIYRCLISGPTVRECYVYVGGGIACL